MYKAWPSNSCGSSLGEGRSLYELLPSPCWKKYVPFRFGVTKPKTSRKTVIRREAISWHEQGIVGFNVTESFRWRNNLSKAELRACSTFYLTYTVAWWSLIIGRLERNKLISFKFCLSIKRQYCTCMKGSAIECYLLRSDLQVLVGWNRENVRM
jgi:hypothetical protein